MPSGGARARSGPPPDPNALRRDRATDAAWTTLPRRWDGPTPEWPLTEPSGREADLWEQLWRRPQALMWDRNQQQVEVALYVRRLVEAEAPKAAVALGTLVRQMQDSLGLSVPGLRSHRWLIEGEEQARGAAQAAKRRPSARQRLKVVTDGDGA